MSPMYPVCTGPSLSRLAGEGLKGADRKAPLPCQREREGPAPEPRWSFCGNGAGGRSPHPPIAAAMGPSLSRLAGEELKGADRKAPLPCQRERENPPLSLSKGREGEGAAGHTARFGGTDALWHHPAKSSGEDSTWRFAC